jgi:hypothetical protein
VLFRIWWVIYAVFQEKTGIDSYQNNSIENAWGKSTFGLAAGMSAEGGFKAVRKGAMLAGKEPVRLATLEEKIGPLQPICRRRFQGRTGFNTT